LLITSAGATPKASLQYIGLSPPVQGIRSRQAPGSALARVNVPNRYLGNKACKYETNSFALSETILQAVSVPNTAVLKWALNSTAKHTEMPLLRTTKFRANRPSEASNSAETPKATAQAAPKSGSSAPKSSQPVGVYEEIVTRVLTVWFDLWFLPPPHITWERDWV
jgi:hypothetical protein